MDIHRDITPQNDNVMYNSNERRITIVLGKQNPGYEETKKFAELIKDKSLSYKDSFIDFYEWNSIFNEDLSSKSLLIEIGTEKSTEEELQNCIEVFAKSLRDVYLSK